MTEFNQRVKREVPLLERGIPFSGNIMVEELPTHFRAPSHLSTYNGIVDPVKHIPKFENATLLDHMLSSTFFPPSNEAYLRIISFCFSITCS